MAAQMAFLSARTGNPIYPLYWNYLANAGGLWMKPLIASQQAARPWFVALWAMATVGLLTTLWRRPRSYLLLLYGFGSCALVFGLFGLTAFITEWYPWRWMMWILAFPYDFAALLVAIGLFVVVPRYVGRGVRQLTWVMAGVLLVGVQLTWIPIETAYTGTAATSRASSVSLTIAAAGSTCLRPTIPPSRMRSCTTVGSRAGTSSASCTTRSITCRLAISTLIIQRRRARSSNAGCPPPPRPSW
jgi:hypothetical protein